jgi:hypothetical protein
MNTFKILKQQNQSGCIPACAASVMRHLGIPRNPDWCEADLLGMYAPPIPQPEPPGFEILKQFVNAHPEMKGWQVVIKDGHGSALKNLVTSVVRQYGPALIPVEGNPAHCVVIIEPDENGAVICDPSKDKPDQECVPWADIQKGWKGGLLHFEKIVRKEQQ